MSALVRLPITLFLDVYPVVAQQYDLGKLSADTLVLYVPPHAHEVVELFAHEHVCVIADAYAQVKVVSDQMEIRKSVRLYAHHHASITYTSAHTGSAEHAIELFLLGQDAHIAVHVVYGITSTDRYTIRTKQEHRVPGSTSSVLIKGIAAGHAVTDYAGTITISEHAPQSNANQQAAALLLSPQARSRSIPSLQVLTNDVRCKHGSAVGQLNQDQLFYAQARGLSYEQARQLLMRGFLAQATTHIPADRAAAIIERIITII